jgi:macrolide-specific efflux system membrane fusion protein
MRIADLSQMTVQARVAEADVTRLKRGMTANFQTPGYPGRTWSGQAAPGEPCASRRHRRARQADFLQRAV